MWIMTCSDGDFGKPWPRGRVVIAERWSSIWWFRWRNIGILIENIKLFIYDRAWITVVFICICLLIRFIFCVPSKDIVHLFKIFQGKKKVREIGRKKKFFFRLKMGIKKNCLTRLRRKKEKELDPKRRIINTLYFNWDIFFCLIIRYRYHYVVTLKQSYQTRFFVSFAFICVCFFFFYWW